MKLIDKDALVAEIRKRLLPVIRDKHYDEWEEGQDSERNAILAIIDTLEVKRVDLEKRIGLFTTKELLNKRNHSTGVYHFTQNDIDNIARHFFELGLNYQTKDMQDALRMEYEKGRADVIQATEQWLAKQGNQKLPIEKF